MTTTWKTHYNQDELDFAVDEWHIHKAQAEEDQNEGHGEKGQQQDPPHGRPGIKAQVLDGRHLCPLSREVPDRRYGGNECNNHQELQDSAQSENIPCITAAAYTPLY